MNSSIDDDKAEDLVVIDLHGKSSIADYFVIASGTKFKVLGKSQVGEQVHGTPAVSGGRMFLRGFEHLYCLEAK